LQDPLKPWTRKEPSAHGVNYRKSVSPDLDHLLPEEHFRLLAATMHYPRQLASRVPLQPQGLGAYVVVWGDRHDPDPGAARDARRGAEPGVEPLQRRSGSDRCGVPPTATASAVVEQSGQ